MMTSRIIIVLTTRAYRIRKNTSRYSEKIYSLVINYVHKIYVAIYMLGIYIYYEHFRRISHYAGAQRGIKIT